MEAEWLASWAASALVMARLSSPTRTRSRTSRARLFRDLVGGGVSKGLGVMGLILGRIGSDGEI